MVEENKLSSADSEERELGSAEGEQENVSEAEGLEKKPSEETEAEYYQKLTGRKDIKSKEDFEKHYEGLKSMVGDQKIAEMRKKAEAYEKLQQEIEQEADEFLESEEGREFKEEIEQVKTSEDVAELKGEIEAMKLTKEHPEAEPYLDTLFAIANQKNISLKEAYENHLQDLVTSKLKAEKAKEEERSIGVESKSRISSAKASKISQLVQQLSKAPTDEAKESLVKEWLSE